MDMLPTNRDYNMAVIKEAKYSITISPPHRSDKNSGEIYQEYKKIIINTFASFAVKYIIYPEYSMDGRLHFHGIYQIHDLIKFKRLIYRIRKIGMVKIDRLKTFNDQLKWIIYCQKEWALTRKVLRIRFPISPVFLKVPKYLDEFISHVIA